MRPRAALRDTIDLGDFEIYGRPLTPSERETVIMVMVGYSLTGASRLTGKSLKTVSFHVSNAKKKLGAKTLANLVARFLAQEQGYLKTVAEQKPYKVGKRK